MLGTRWGGTAITAAQAAAYKAAGVQWAAVKVSDGTTGGGNAVIADMQACWDGGLGVIPWCFIEPTAGDAGPQMHTCFLASGSGQKLAIADVEAQPAGIAGLTTQFAKVAVTTWGNPVPTHDGQPSIGQLADIGVGAILPQAYAGAWGVSEPKAISGMIASYKAANLSNLPPLLPIGDTANMVAFAQAAKAAGCNGVSAWRHGANGISPASFQGIAAIFPAPAPPDPPAPPPPTPVQLQTGVVYLTPRGDRLTLG